MNAVSHEVDLRVAIRSEPYWRVWWYEYAVDACQDAPMDLVAQRTGLGRSSCLY